jgi:heterogeneous nuclear ribonucleoprotein R
VEYYNHSCAENARRKLTMPGFKFGTNIPTVNWADARGTGGTGESATATSQVKKQNIPYKHWKSCGLY